THFPYTTLFRSSGHCLPSVPSSGHMPRFEHRFGNDVLGRRPGLSVNVQLADKRSAATCRIRHGVAVAAADSGDELIKRSGLLRAKNTLRLMDVLHHEALAAS